MREHNQKADKAVTSEELEFGYTHEGQKDRDGYYPITSFSNQRWFSTVEEAEYSMKDDLRWRTELFLISRPRPCAGQRYTAE